MKIKVGDLRKLIREASETVISGGKEFEVEKDEPEDDFTDGQYALFARKIVDKYNAHPEMDWRKAAIQFVNSMKATNGITLDPQRLQDSMELEMDARKELFNVQDPEY